LPNLYDTLLREDCLSKVVGEMCRPAQQASWCEDITGELLDKPAYYSEMQRDAPLCYRVSPRFTLGTL